WSECNQRVSEPIYIRLRIWGSGVRISSGAPLRYKTGHSKTCRFSARCGDERAQQYAFRPHDANFFRVHLDALRERAEVVATVAAAVGSHSFAGLRGERFESLRRDARPEPIERTLGPLCVSAGLITDGPKLGHTLFEHRVGDVGDAVLDRV